MTTLFNAMFAKIVGNGLIVNNQGQMLSRSLVPDYGIEIDNPMGRTGNPTLRASEGGKLRLGSLLGADLNSTSDQIIQIAEFPKYIVTDIFVTNASGNPTTAVGGFYTATSKAGYALVASSQAYSGLTDNGLIKVCTIAVQRVLTGPNIYLSLTTPQGSAMTADVHVFGHWLKT